MSFLWSIFTSLFRAKKDKKMQVTSTNFWADSTLTLENYSERAKAAFGKATVRFKVTNEQSARIKAGTLTREGAFREFVAAKLND